MVFANPPLDLLPKVKCERRHLFSLFFRDGTAHLITAHVTLLAKGVEAANLFTSSPDGKFKRLDHAAVVSLMTSAVAGRSERGSGGLQGRIICNREPPIRHEPFGGTACQVPVSESQESLNFFGAGSMLACPAASYPVLQAHAHPQ